MTLRSDQTGASPDGDIQRKNQQTATRVVAVVVGMVGLAFASVPAYKVFCQVTGWGGTTQRAEANDSRVIDRKITVRFDGTVERALPWRFKPAQQSQTLKVGETGLAFYEAENLSDKPITGQATFNVSPAKAGVYFSKVECFCFTEQVLQPGEKVSMPVTYFVDPAIAEDDNLSEVETVTLAYTFFRWDDDETELASAE
ncbi:MAG: cytochrome c oxidase assembly protein [Pseudomonadota bacterium]